MLSSNFNFRFLFNFYVRVPLINVSFLWISMYDFLVIELVHNNLDLLSNVAFNHRRIKSYFYQSMFHGYMYSCAFLFTDWLQINYRLVCLVCYNGRVSNSVLYNFYSRVQHKYHCFIVTHVSSTYWCYSFDYHTTRANNVVQSQNYNHILYNNYF